MSGLLVKSTVVMKENLEELNARGMATSYPVLLGGAALTRAYVEQDLREVFAGEVRYARDAFEGLRLMDALMAVKRGEEGAALPAPRERRVKARDPAPEPVEGQEPTPARSDVAVDVDVPTPPFWGDRIVKGIALADVASLPGRAGHLHGAVGAQGLAQRTVVRGAGRGRGPAPAAGLAGPDPDRGRRGVRRGLRLLALLQRGQRPGRAAARRRGGRPGGRAAPLRVPAAAAAALPVPGRLLPRPRAGRGQGPGRGRVPPGHHGFRGVAR